MPELTQSLWNIEQGWSALLTEREDMLEQLVACQVAKQPEAEAEAAAHLCRIDEAIVAHAKREVRKVDGIRGIWKHLQMQHAAATEEARVQSARAKAIEANLNALKSAVQITMEEMPWVAGKTRKLEGRLGALYLKGNGGRRAVTITDEAMVPDEFCVYEGRIRGDIWNALLLVAKTVARSNGASGDALLEDLDSLQMLRLPSISTLYDALTEKCQTCADMDLIVYDAEGSEVAGASCASCGGSRLAGVPGAYLAPLGSHVEVR